MESTCLDGFGDLKQYLDTGDGYIVAYAVTGKNHITYCKSINV